MYIVALLLIGLAPSPSPLASCAWVRAENDGSGAGFVVDSEKKWLITCRHVVADRDKVDVFFPWLRDGKLVAEKSEYVGNRPLLRERGLLVNGKVIRKSDDADLALVELETLPSGVTSVRLADNRAQLSDPLRAIGHRIDLDTLFNVTAGSVRQTGRLSEGYHWRGKKLAVNADAIIGQLPIEEGDSGGPVLNDRGELVGIVSALRRQTPSAAVAISAGEIRRFLESKEPVPARRANDIGDKLTRATVWIRPTATDFHLAGALIEKNLILTSAKGLGPSTHVGVAFPLLDNGRFIGERAPYRDPLGLYLKGAWRAGEVIARDPNRDLAVVRIPSAPDWMRPLPVGEKLPASGDAIHEMSHPGGLEFAWVYAAGNVRQTGSMALTEGENSRKVRMNVLQLPAQSGSPGGPIVDDRGNLIGILSARESAQQTGYAATTDEISTMLDSALPDRPLRSHEALAARMANILDRGRRGLADGLTFWASGLGTNDMELSPRLNAIAVLIDPGRSQSYLLLAMHEIMVGSKTEAEELFEAAVTRGRFDPLVICQKTAFISLRREQWRTARAELERVLDVHPENTYARRLLVRALMGLNKDDEAAAAVGDVLRADPRELPAVARLLLDQATDLTRKFPNTPSVPSNWLNRAIRAAHKSTADFKQSAEIEVVLKAAAEAPDDAARLAVLRAFLEKKSKKE